MEIFWSNDDQAFHTIPDGDKATHQEIKKYYENKLRNMPINYKSSVKGTRANEVFGNKY